MITDFYLIEKKREGVHWCWWVVWLLIFPPVLALTALFHFTSPYKYFVAVKYADGKRESLWVDEGSYSQMVVNVGFNKEGSK